MVYPKITENFQQMNQQKTISCLNIFGLESLGQMWWRPKLLLILGGFHYFPTVSPYPLGYNLVGKFFCISAKW